VRFFSTDNLHVTDDKPCVSRLNYVFREVGCRRVFLIINGNNQVSASNSIVPDLGGLEFSNDLVLYQLCH
jgi:hypothetical protein